jgi:Methyltransferase FkbM domain
VLVARTLAPVIAASHRHGVASSAPRRRAASHAAPRPKVPVQSLDSLVAEHGSEGRLVLIKIDVEGYESQVLAGATETLARFRPLLYVEFNDQILRDAGSSSIELLGRFLDSGYRVVDGAGPAAARLHMRVVDPLLEPVNARAGS